MKFMSSFLAALFCSLTIGLSFGTLYAEHRPNLQWMQGYKDDNGIPCCGTNDCVEVEAKVVEQGPDYVVVTINGTTMKLRQSRVSEWHGKVHFHSNDNTDYWCFYPPEIDCDVDSACPSLPNKAPGTLKSVIGRSAPLLTPDNTACVFISYGW